MDRIAKFGAESLGKGIVIAKDTPNFVGNRIGTHAMMLGIQQMVADKLAPGRHRRDHRAADGSPPQREFRTA
ncbi:MAG: hypothetical protein R3B07_13940 [Polyangiaceae bacterium]